MITNYKQFVDHNKRFYDAFVDLKVEGWRSYSTALNAYTFNFFKAQLDTANDTVEQVSKLMKGELDV